MRTYTAIPHEYLEEMDCLSDAEFGRLVRALLQYSASGEEANLTGTERLYWKRVRNQEIRYRESFDTQDKAKTERAQKAAKARWNDAQACTSILSNAKNAINKNKTKQKTNKEKENSIPSGIEQKKSCRFSPPTLAEVQAYCIERNNAVDAKAFYDYFSVGGWIDAKGQPVKNWKQKLITWEKFEPTTTKPAQKRKSWAELGAELDAQRERERTYDSV